MNMANNEDVELYFPWFERYADKFQITCLVPKVKWQQDRSSYEEIKWENLRDAGDVTRFQQMQPKQSVMDKIDEAMQKIASPNLVAVHIRHADFRHWNEGASFFDAKTYMDTAMKAIDGWGLKDYRIVVFSDEDQRNLGHAFSWDLTGGCPVTDLYLMSKFNYFVKTFSTFSGVAMRISQINGHYKDHYNLFR